MIYRKMLIDITQQEDKLLLPAWPAANSLRQLAIVATPLGFHCRMIATGNHTIIHGNVNVVTYEELFQFLLVIISFAGLIITIIKKK